MVFGPGAVIASLTIGSGELIFSSRGGALFGYRLLGVFLLVCVLKWILVFGTARHMVLSGAHPFQRWRDLPGPRGWLPTTFLILAAVAFPIWVGFHAGTIGTLAASLGGNPDPATSAAPWLWGFAILTGVLALALTGGYARLERFQRILVFVMLACVAVSLILLEPQWGEMFRQFFQFHDLAYPDWIGNLPSFADRPVWVELVTYVGVVGGSGYDYLAYVSYLRAKGWGQAGSPMLDRDGLRAVADRRDHPNRQWVRGPLIDCTLSFAIVFLFSAVFLACGTEILRPQEAVPEGGNLLTLQSQFVTGTSEWLGPIYFAGAFLAMLGTLYGTVEVAPAVFGEFLRSFQTPNQPEDTRKPDAIIARRARWAVWWAGVGGLIILAANGAARLMAAPGLPGLVAILTPANLFTGVLACGIICVLALWADYRFLPRNLRPGTAFQCLMALSGLTFLLLGIKGYWDHSGLNAFWILAGSIGAGCIGAKWFHRNR